MPHILFQKNFPPHNLPLSLQGPPVLQVFEKNQVQIYRYIL